MATRLRTWSCSNVNTRDRSKQSSRRTLKVLYHRPDGSFERFGLHAFLHVRSPTSWDAPLRPARIVGEWAEYRVQMKEDASQVGLLMHDGDEKDVETVLEVDPSTQSTTVYLVSGTTRVWKRKPDLQSLPKGDLSYARGHWIRKDTLVWRVPPGAVGFMLHWSASSDLRLDGSGVCKQDGSLRLHTLSETDDKIFVENPHLRGCTILGVDPSQVDIHALVKCQLAVSCTDANGKPLDASGVQIPALLDDMFAYDGPLGASFHDNGGISLHLWAPTARKVKLELFEGPDGSVSPSSMIDMEENDGVWRVDGSKDWYGMFYRFVVEVFCPWTNQVEVSLATDPYSRNLAADGTLSQLVDLNCPELKPEGWDGLELRKPPLSRHADAVIYELHVRDFSAMDSSVPANLRGKYLAFTVGGSTGTNHLKHLAQSGITHVHLLPTYDFGTVPEREQDQQNPDIDLLATFGPADEEQQEMVINSADLDAFNWGYDPVHYGVPEGSYSTNPDGIDRIIEYRKMVLALNEMKIRLVCDVVYNHTLSSGPQSQLSVLDKVVPGYYHRRNENGMIEASTCMNNTASERYMFNRFIVDDILHWAKDFKVDGFRFDLMGHLMLSTMKQVRKSLDGLTLANDGVDGKSIILYGEGWDFGEVASNGRGVNACQLNLASTGIGSFNDRLRESVNGGSPFADVRLQGFCTGIFTAPNEFEGNGNLAQQLETLLHYSDLIKVSISGNLRDFILIDKDGKERRGSELDYGGSIAGYCDEPFECINYVSAHDNETLFDTHMLKACSFEPLSSRIRMNYVALALVALSQGIPFFHAGDEVLRSKSLDRDSYNSGDWFNRLDFTGETHNFGIGLPPASKNAEKWGFMRSLLLNKMLKPKKSQILRATEYLLELLEIRRSSPLFCLGSSKEVIERLVFYNNGPQQVPGVILMQIDGGDGDALGILDERFSRVVVVFNASPTDFLYTGNDMMLLGLDLHPIQMQSNDFLTTQCVVESQLGTMFVPGRTVAVFVEHRQ